MTVRSPKLKGLRAQVKNKIRQRANEVNQQAFVQNIQA